MLKIKNVSKVYSMNGVTVRALDDVSVSFQERGMVFLLGKSGSGKSTLLNICGGLDAADSGEVIVKGRSSKDFSPSDFDSYRNTFVGFIFQEYNVLEEFSVGENISLALELQGKAADAARVAEILHEVDLDGLEKRKPNTLSGGQKQRVAIARALVKNPEIIMADEPTGALDSATGKQVFDTLKKLSREKLVIVVSHDRDFAEQYADRIIELKDGRIVSDVTRSEQGAGEENIVFVGENAISVRSGAKLTASDLEKINAFLTGCQRDVFITSEPKEVEISSRARGMQGAFRPTQQDDEKLYDGRGVRFIKSKLPVRHAARMGLSSMRRKPFRLAFTIFLSTIAFVMFGLLSTIMMYNENNVIARAIDRGHDVGVAISKDYRVRFQNEKLGEYDVTGFETVMTEAEIETLNLKNQNLNFAGVYNYRLSTISLRNAGSEARSGYYYTDRILGFSEMSEEELADHGIEIICGEYPSSPYEVAISSFFAKMFMDCGYYEIGENGAIVSEPKTVSTVEEMVGKTIYLTLGESVTVTAVLDCGEISEAYAYLRDVVSMTYFGNPNYYEDRQNYYELNDLLSNSFQRVLFIGKGAYYALKPDGADFTDVVTHTDPTYASGETEYRHPDVSEAKEAGQPLYNLAVTSLNETGASQLKTIVSAQGVYAGDARYQMQNMVVESVQEVDEVLEVIERIVMIAGCVLAAFACLLLFNFITVSIRGKEKEIGILRAVGARGIDVFKIFCIESLFITMCCFLLADILSPLLCLFINLYLESFANLTFELLIFGAPSILCILLLSLFIALLSTYFPVRSAVRRKPVEVIRAL